MFNRKTNDELWRLQEELMAAEEEDTESDPNEYLTEFLERKNQKDNEKSASSSHQNRSRESLTTYQRGSKKDFSHFNHGADFDEPKESEVLYKKDYKKAKRKKRWKNLALLILAILEIAAIGAILLWFMSWMQ